MKERVTMRCFRFWLVLALSGCAGGGTDDAVGERTAAVTPVTWTDVVGVSASGSDLAKTAPETLWNAGAASVESLSGDGYVEFTTAESTTDKMIGLSSGNGGTGYADIDFAIRLNSNGQFAVYEAGTSRGGFGAYVAGDRFRVQVAGGVVSYWKNGAAFYTSPVAPTLPLLVDTSLRTPGATVTEVALESLVFWQNVVRASAVAGDLTRTATTATWNAGGSSVASIPSGDGHVQFRAGDNLTAKAAGLSSGDSDPGLDDIDFAIVLSDTGTVAVREGGVARGGYGPYLPDDVFAVQVVGGVVSYFHNNVLFYTSAAVPVYPLVLDASIRTPGGAILDARLVAGQGVPDCAPFRRTFFGGEGKPRFYGEHMEAGVDHALVENDVFRQNAGVWTLAEEVGPFSRIDDDGVTMIQGDHYGDTMQVFRRVADQWVADGVLTLCPGDEIFDQAVWRNRIVIGVADKAYVYRRGTAGWTLQGIVRPDDGGSPGYVGQLSVAGSRFFAADRDGGAIYVFRYDGAVAAPLPTCDSQTAGKWRQEAVLMASNGFGLLFSMDVNRSGTALVAGNYAARTANIFELEDGVWSETAVLRGYPDSRWFGISVAFGGPDPDGDSVAMVGTELTSDLSLGRAFLFARPGGLWRQIDMFEGPRSYYGSSVAASASSVFVGDRIRGGGTGAFQVFDISPACLSQ